MWPQESMGHKLLFPPPKPLVSPFPQHLEPAGCWGVNLGCGSAHPRLFWGAQSSFLSLKSAEKEEGFTPQTQPCFTKLKHGWGGGGCESCKLLSHLVFQIPLSSDPLSDAKLAGQIVFFFQRGMDLNRLIRV